MTRSEAPHWHRAVKKAASRALSGASWGSHERGVDGGAGGGQRAAGPPQVQLAGMQRGVADLLALRDGVDGLDGQVVLDQPPVIGHALTSSIASPGTR